MMQHFIWVFTVCQSSHLIIIELKELEQNDMVPLIFSNKYFLQSNIYFQGHYGAK